MSDSGIGGLTSSEVSTALSDYHSSLGLSDGADLNSVIQQGCGARRVRLAGTPAVSAAAPPG